MHTPLPHTIHDTARLLVEGGDERIHLDPVTGLNRYGCRATPDPALLSFSSATASVISGSAYAAADALRDTLQQVLQTQDAEMVYDRELARIRSDLLDLCDLSADNEVIFAASGTDLHQIAAQIALASGKAGLSVLMVTPQETGSGVQSSISYASPDIHISNVALRQADGTARPAAKIDAEFSRLALQADAQGRQVLLIQTDVSKTGMIAPSYACTASLAARLGDRLDVLIDACQFRLSTTTLQACLARGYNVALTGSKFIGGPSFSGAMIIPARQAERIQQRYAQVSPALPAGSASNIWQSRYIDAGSWGMLLRWEAALAELRAFRQVPEHTVASFLRDFSDAITTHLARDPHYAPLALPALQRAGLHDEHGWDEIGSIHTFRLRDANMELLDEDRLARLYSALPHAATPCAVGQPVACAKGKDALRLCLSARQIVTASRSPSDAAHIIVQALQVLDQIAALTERPAARVLPHRAIRTPSGPSPVKRVALG